MPDIKANATLPLTNAFQTLYQNNNVLSLTVSIFRITNVTAGAITVSMCYVPPGGTANAANAVIWDFSVPANNFIEFGKGDIIDPSVSIQAKASANNSITVKLSGIQS